MKQKNRPCETNPPHPPRRYLLLPWREKRAERAAARERAGVRGRRSNVNACPDETNPPPPPCPPCPLWLIPNLENYQTNPNRKPTAPQRSFTSPAPTSAPSPEKPQHHPLRTQHPQQHHERVDRRVRHPRRIRPRDRPRE